MVSTMPLAMVGRTSPSDFQPRSLWSSSRDAWNLATLTTRARRSLKPESSEKRKLTGKPSPRLQVVVDGVSVIVPNGYQRGVLGPIDPVSRLTLGPCRSGPPKPLGNKPLEFGHFFVSQVVHHVSTGAVIYAVSPRRCQQPMPPTDTNIVSLEKKLSNTPYAVTW